MNVKLHKITSYKNFQNFNCVFTILVKFDIHFLGLPWEIFLWCYYLARLVAGTGDLGQDSPTQTSARLIRCLLYGKTSKQRNKNINNFNCFPARAQAFSWLSSVTGLQSKRDKNNCSKSSFVQTSSMNEGKTFHSGSMKRSHSALRSHDLRLIITETVDVKCAA